MQARGSAAARCANREPDDDPHWPCRITLRPRDPRNSRERSATRCQMQKFSAGKFHSMTWSVEAARGDDRKSITSQNDGLWPEAAQIEDVKVVTMPSNTPAVERKIAFAEFIEWVRSANNDVNLTLTGISF